MNAALAAGVIAWVAVMSLVTWQAFARDKRAAELGEWRVPEKTLLTLAAIGGTPGAFAAQRILRHKTQKQPFGAILVLIAIAQVGLLVALQFPEVSDVVLRAIERELR